MMNKAAKMNLAVGMGVAILGVAWPFHLPPLALKPGPGDPLGDIKTGLSKKPGGIAALGKPQSQIEAGWGKPNLDSRQAGLSLASIARGRITSEAAWAIEQEVPNPYALDRANGVWNADFNRKGKLRIIQQVGFGADNRAVVVLVRFEHPLGQGAEMTSAVTGMLGNSAWQNLTTRLDDPNGPRQGTYTNLPYTAQNHARLIAAPGKGGGTNTVQQKVWGNSASGAVRKSSVAFSAGVVDAHPVLLLGDAWDANPVGGLSPQVPEALTPILWQGGTPATGGGKGGAISTLGSTVPGVDIIIKKCPCGVVQDGEVAVVTNVRWMLFGEFDARRAESAFRARGQFAPIRRGGQ